MAAISKQFARQLLTIGENRLELLTVEVQEERERVLLALILALGMAAFGLLAGVTLTAAIVVLLRGYSTLVVLLALTALYGITAYILGRRLNGMRSNRQAFSATLDELRKDRACLEQILT